MTALADRFRALEPLTGLFLTMPGADVVELAAYAGFDFVVLDAEHGPGDPLELAHHLRAADAARVPALVRTPGFDEAFVLRALDLGAAGVVVPHVVSRAGAEAVVAAARYPPLGRRGLSTGTRAGRYSTAGLAAHLDRAAAETCVVPMVEDAEAVEHAGAIAAVDGVTAVLVGPGDLSMSLGHPGEPSHPDVAAAIDRVVTATRAVGVPSIGVAGRLEDARRWRERGAPAVVLPSSALLLAAFRAAVDGLR